MHKSKPKSQKKWKSFHTHLCKVIKSRYKKVIGSDGKADFNPDDVHKEKKSSNLGERGKQITKPKLLLRIMETRKIAM